MGYIKLKWEVKESESRKACSSTDESKVESVEVLTELGNFRNKKLALVPQVNSVNRLKL